MTVWQFFIDAIVFVVHCRSIKNKIHELDDLIKTLKPSVVIVTKSWFNDDIMNGDVFPDNFVCYRKGRNNRGGGVFILVDQYVPSSPIAVPSTACEAVGCQKNLLSGESLSVGSFYCPPASSVEVLARFACAVEAVQADRMVVAGECNLVDLDWQHQPVFAVQLMATIQR